MTVIDIIKKTPYYFCLFALYPVLSLFSINTAEVNYIFIVRPLLFSIVSAVLLFGILSLITHNPNRSALITAIGFLLFFSYGLIFQGVNGISIFASTIGKRQVFLPSYCIVSGGFIFLLSKVQDKQKDFTFGMNLIGIILVIMPIITIITHPMSFNPKSSYTRTVSPIPVDNNSSSPDIYYFILDAYARADYLKEYIQVDSSELLQGLKDRGFFIGDCSLSNYAFTRLSLTSSLNLDYLENWPGTYKPSNTNHNLVDGLIKNSLVRQTLEQAGYQTVAFESGYKFTSFSDADYYFAPNNNPLLMKALSAFESMALDNSFLGGLKKFSLFKPFLGWINPYHEKFLREKYIIRQVKNIPDIPGKKFVFIHLVTSHRPYIFNSDGSLLTDDGYFINNGNPLNEEYFIRGYRYQIEYTNSFLLDVVDTIIAKSKTPPVIILQGDHGVQSPARFAILNAIYYQGQDLHLYPSISPVNTFRVILTKLGIGNYDLLPDYSYFSNQNKSPYKLDKLKGEASQCRIR